MLSVRTSGAGECKPERKARYRPSFIALLFISLAAASCAPLAPGLPGVPGVPKSGAPAAGADPQRARFVASTFAALPGWQADDLTGLVDALKRQCPAPTPGLEPQAPRHPAQGIVCRRLASLPQAPGALREWFERQFEPWSVVAEGGRTEGLITGYYEPLLNGSRQAGGLFTNPIRARPQDLLVLDLGSVYPETAKLRLRGRLASADASTPRVVPYASRAELAREPTGKAIAWVDDPIDAFFLEIQGSGRIKLDDGSLLRVGYADQNGHPYRAIGRELIRRGALSADTVSAPAIRQWLRENPREATAVLESNPSVVFFRELPTPTEPDAGPPGALGVSLTATRSVAVDPQALPLGALLYLSTEHPMGGRLDRTVVAQDTGGAIRGAIRADFFWGFNAVNGVSAAELAGQMRKPGQLWLLWPRGEALPD